MTKKRKTPVFRLELGFGPDHSLRFTYYRAEGRGHVSHQVTGFGSMAQKASLIAEQGAALLRGVRRQLGRRILFWRRPGS